MPSPIKHPSQPHIRRALTGRHPTVHPHLKKTSFFSQCAEWIVVAGVMFFFSCLFTLPAILHLSSHFISDGGDLYLFAMDHVHQQMNVGLYPFGETTALRYPIGYDFGVGIDAVLAVVVGAGLLSFFSPVATYNLTVLLLLTINGLTSYFSFKYLSKSRLVGVVGAVIFGYSFYVLARGAGHLNLLIVAGFPILAALATKFSSAKTSFLTIFTLYFAGLLLAWGSIQYAVMAAILTAVTTILASVFYPKVLLQIVRSVSKNWKLHLLFASIVGSFFLWSFWPTLNAMLSGQFISREQSSAETYDVELRHFFIADSVYTNTFFTKLLPHDVKPNIEHAVLFGYVELLLLIGFFLTKKPAKQKGFLAALFFIFFIFSLGVREATLPAPYALLAKHFPFSAIAEPGRYVTVLMLLIAVFASYVLGSFKKRSVRVTISSIILVLLVLERIPTGYFQVKADVAGLKTVEQQPGNAVLNLPINFYRQEYSLVPVFAKKSIIDGYIHWSTNTDASRLFVDEPDGDLKRFICQMSDQVYEKMKSADTRAETEKQEADKNTQMLSKLKANGVRTLIIHKDADFFHPQCTNVRSRLNLLIPAVKEAEPSTATTQFVAQIHEGKLQASLYFPKEGVFSLRGVAASDPETLLTATLHAQPINLPESLKAKLPSGVVYTTTDEQGQVYQEFKYSVQAGTYFNVTSDKITDFGSVTIWYDYQSSSQAQDIRPTLPFKHLYSDENIEVLSVQ